MRSNRCRGRHPPGGANRAPAGSPHGIRHVPPGVDPPGHAKVVCSPLPPRSGSGLGGDGKLASRRRRWPRTACARRGGGRSLSGRKWPSQPFLGELPRGQELPSGPVRLSWAHFGSGRVRRPPRKWGRLCGIGAAPKDVSFVMAKGHGHAWSFVFTAPRARRRSRVLLRAGEIGVPTPGGS